jgi:hypothetical protein
MTPEDVFQAAVAKMNAASDARSAWIAKFEADARFAKLDEYIAIFGPSMPRHGWDGFADVVTGLMSAQHWRTKRATALRAARKCQIKGDAVATAFWLSNAASNRKTEHLYRAADRREMYRGLILTAAGLPALREADVHTQAAE